MLSSLDWPIPLGFGSSVKLRLSKPCSPISAVHGSGAVAPYPRLTMAFQATLAAHITQMDRELGTTAASPDEAYQMIVRAQRATRDAFTAIAMGMDSQMAATTAQIASLSTQVGVLS